MADETERSGTSLYPNEVTATEPAPPEEPTPIHIEKSQEARRMAMLCHFLGIIGFVGPLVVWLSEREKHRFVSEHGGAAMNYQLSMIVYVAACYLSLLCSVDIGGYLLAVLALLHVAFVIIGSWRATRGKLWRYPIALPFL